MNRSQYQLPAAGSPPQAISATQASRLVEIREDGSTSLQGIVLYFAKDSFTAGYTYAPQVQPAVMGNKVAHGRGRGPIVGLPAQPNLGMPATVLFKATSAGAAPTTIDVTEYD